MNLRKFVELVISAILLYLCSLYSVVSAEPILPDLGSIDRSQLSASQAADISKQVLAGMYASGSLITDWDTQVYLTQLCNKIALNALLLPGACYVVASNDINAFAVPGWSIYVYDGLLYAVTTEAELAAVLSHEVAHLSQHHVERSINGSKNGQVLSIAGVIAGIILAPFAPQLAMLSVQGGMGLALQSHLSFSRDYEQEADRIGQQLLTKTAFSPAALPQFLQKLNDSAKFNTQSTLAFLQTHPLTPTRLSEARANLSHAATFDLHVDSIDFLLIREKVRVRQLSPARAIKFYQHALQFGNYVNLDAQYYGLAWSYLLSKQLTKSIAAINKVSSINNQTAIILHLKALQAVAQHNFIAADAIYSAALQRYPQAKNLWLEHISMLIDNKQYAKAVQVLNNFRESTDPDLWEQAARLYADGALNMPGLYFYALGTRDIALANKKDAIWHYNQAIKYLTLQKNLSLLATIHAKMSLLTK